METKTALLMTEPGSLRNPKIRSLYEMEGTRDGRMWSNDQSVKFHSVKVRPASNELIKSELLRLDLVIEDIPTILKVAERFRQDLCSGEEGKLASYWSGKGNTLWEICEIIREESRNT